MVNAAASRIFGRDREEMLGRACNDPVWGIMRPDGRPFAKKELACARALKTAQPAHGLEYHIKRPDGSDVIALVSAIPLRDEAGQVTAVLNTYVDITEQRHADEALRESRERYRALAETAEDFIFIVDRQGCIAYVNSAAAAIAGAPAQELVGKPAGEALGIASFKKQGDDVREVFATGKPVRAEDHLQMRTGAAWIETSLVPLKNEAGEVTAVTGIARDITERKQSEGVIRDSEERYRLLFEGNPQPMWVYDLDTLAFLAVNEATVRTYGYSRREFLSMTMVDIRPPEDISALLDSISRLAEGLDQSGVWRHRKKDGTILDVDVGAHAVMFDGKRAALVLASDVTGLRQAERELADNERFLNSVFASIQDGISVLDRDMNIIRVNRAMEQWYSYAMPLTGKRCYEAYHGCDRICDPCPSARALETGQPANDVVPKRDPDGRIIGWLDLFAFPLVDQTTGQTEGVIEYVRDITERSKAKEELQASEERYRRLVESSPDGIAVQSDSTVVFINSAGAKILGAKDPEEIIGRPFLDFILPSDRATITPTLRKEPSSTRKVEEQLLRIDGTVVDVEAIRIPLVYQGRESMQVVFRDITDRNDAEAKLRWLATFPVLNPDPVIEVDLEGAITYVNPATEKRLPDLASSGLAHPLLEGLPELATEVARSPDKKMASEISVGDSLYHRVVRDVPGHNRLRIYAVDITERRQAEQALRESEEKYRTMVEFSNDMIWALDAQGNFTYFNETAEEISGYSLVDWLGRSFAPLIVEEDLPGALEVFRKTIEGEPQQYDVRFRAADGTVHALSVNTTRIIERGKTAGTVSFARDVTDQRRAQQELKDRDLAIRQAYVDVLAAVTGNKLILMMPEEIQKALGEPVNESRVVTSYEGLSEARAHVKEALEQHFPGIEKLDEFIVGVCEALTNAVKHAGSGRYQVFRRDATAQLLISDEGPGVDFKTLPKATLESGFSTTSTLGMGFTIMLELSDKVLLSTEAGSTTVVLETSG